MTALKKKKIKLKKEKEKKNPEAFAPALPFAQPRGIRVTPEWLRIGPGALPTAVLCQCRLQTQIKAIWEHGGVGGVF